MNAPLDRMQPDTTRNNAPKMVVQPPSRRIPVAAELFSRVLFRSFSFFLSLSSRLLFAVLIVSSIVFLLDGLPALLSGSSSTRLDSTRLSSPLLGHHHASSRALSGGCRDGQQQLLLPQWLPAGPGGIGHQMYVPSYSSRDRNIQS